MALRRIIRAVDIYSRKLNTDFKITAPQLICLCSLVKVGRATLSELADEVSLGISTVNGIVDRLEEKGLLTRTRSSSDRRKLVLAVTQRGREVAESAPVLLQDRLSDSLRRLSELEQVTLALSLERVVELMKVGHLDASPNLAPGSSLNETPEATSR
ncbi:MarR family transcriptional regulator [Candidatus Sumerlaeota bacterium]|nr:MarR family transcriptional regulator [Candidatus Sumerlaeota bacterium]